MLGLRLKLGLGFGLGLGFHLMQVNDLNYMVSLFPPLSVYVALNKSGALCSALPARHLTGDRSCAFIAPSIS